MNTDSGPLLDVTGLTKKYDGRVVLSDLSLRVPVGTAVALIGPKRKWQEHGAALSQRARGLRLRIVHGPEPVGQSALIELPP